MTLRLHPCLLGQCSLSYLFWNAIGGSPQMAGIPHLRPLSTMEMVPHLPLASRTVRPRRPCLPNLPQVCP